MSQSKSKCWYSNNCSHFLKGAVPLEPFKIIDIMVPTRLYNKWEYNTFNHGILIVEEGSVQLTS